MQTSGRELLLLAARHGQQRALEELTRARADCDAASRFALLEHDYAAARMIIRAGQLPLPFSDVMDDGESVFR